MFTWGVIVFISLWLILKDVKPVTKAKMMGSPFLIHFIVIGSGLWIHGGSADGAMAAIVSGVFSALYVRWQQRFYGYIRRGVWHAGVLRSRSETRSNRMNTTVVRDLYADTTARIVAALEQGTAPWVRPWSTGIDTLPMNGGTQRPYRGINVLLLELEAATSGYALNRWLTYRQAMELRGQVRKGERGTTVVFWKMRKVDATPGSHHDENEPEVHERVIPLLRAHTVFNVAQVDRLPAALTEVAPAAWAPEAKAEELLAVSGAVIRHGGAKAYYCPGTDDVHLPPRHLFASADRYYNVALHELTHWTSHESRCNRQLGKRFGDDAYAAEELVAEMGAAFLCAHCRIDGELRHAGYLDSWLKVLRTDKRAIFVAATRAQQAADYLFARLQPASTEALAA